MANHSAALKIKRLIALITLGAFVTYLANAQQNVGIGTTTPTTNLHIQGGGSAGLLVQNINGLGQSSIEIKSSTTVNESLTLIHHNSNSSGTLAGLSLSGSSVIRTGVNNTGGMIIGTMNNSAVFFISNNARRITLSGGGTLAIGNGNPDASAQLDVQSTTRGLLIPRLTTAQRNAVATPANGLLVYNTTTNSLNYFKTGDGWTEVGAGGGGGDAWLTTGNFTAPPGATLGTFNQEPLRFRVGGQHSGMFWYDAEANTFAGYASGVPNQTGNDNNRANTGFGTSTLTGLTTGNRNTAVGTEAGFAMTTGTRNVYMGRQAGYMHTTQSGNVAIGSSALYHSKGNDHVAIGDSAYFGAATGNASSANIAIGKKAMASATTAASNIAIGRVSLGFITTGTNNTIIGNNAFGSSSSIDGGQHNIALGSNAMFSAKGGLFNIGLGSLSLRQNEGSYNVGVGPSTLWANTTGIRNVAMGHTALYNSGTASYQVAIGDSALFSFTGAMDGNTAIGAKAGWQLTNGSENTILGFRALPQGMGTSKNTVVGAFAMTNTIGGVGNTVVGYAANTKGVSGQNSVAIGTDASAGNNASIAMGYQSNATGANSVSIGANSSALANAVAIGADAAATDNFSMVLGSSAITSWRFGRSDNPGNRAMIVGTNNTNGNAAYLTTGGTWTNNSDINLKDDISQINNHDILQKIAGMPITRWKYKGTNEYHIGPMAQDFHAAFSTGLDDKGISSIDPAGVSLAAIQALLERIEKLENEIIILKNK